MNYAEALEALFREFSEPGKLEEIASVHKFNIHHIQIAPLSGCSGLWLVFERDYLAQNPFCGLKVVFPERYARSLESKHDNVGNTEYLIVGSNTRASRDGRFSEEFMWLGYAGWTSSSTTDPTMKGFERIVAIQTRLCRLLEAATPLRVPIAEVEAAA